jgi:hypothetical protein
MPEREPIVAGVPGERPTAVSHVVLNFNGPLLAAQFSAHRR